MSGRVRAPKIASTMEWYTTSPSEWATTPSCVSYIPPFSTYFPSASVHWKAKVSIYIENMRCNAFIILPFDLCAWFLHHR
jgi:hypothetical protein